MIIRRATGPDRHSVLTLAQESSTSSGPEPAVFAATFDRLLTSSTALLLVAEVHGAVCGYLLAQLNETFHANGRVVWGQEIFVSAERRGEAVGRALMRQMDAWAREQEANYIALASRRAGGFYLALGYDESAVFYKKRTQ